jgi:hypothetical protein
MASTPYDDLHEDTQERYYCDRHELIHVKNALGEFVCPFCEATYDEGRLERLLRWLR